MFDDLIKLINAGFTHDEIMQLTAGAPAAPEAPQEASPAEDPTAEDPTAESEPGAAPEISPKTAPEASGETDYINTLRSEINDLRKLIQKNNVMTAEQQSSRTTQKTDTDIIANILLKEAKNVCKFHGY